MKVAIDARWIFSKISGIGSYTRELIGALAALDSTVEMVLLFDDEAVAAQTVSSTEMSRCSRIESCIFPHSVFSLKSQLVLPSLLKKQGVDVYHAPNYMIPYRAFPKNRKGSCACVVTLHDLIPLLFPHYTPRAMKTRFFPVFKRVMKETVERADAVITPSNSSLHDVVSEFGLRRDDPRLFAVPEGVNPVYSPLPLEEKSRHTFLYVGRFDPYKNVETLLAAFAQVVQSEPGTELMLIGEEDSRYPEARRRAVSLGIEHAVQWRGYVTKEELIQAYRAASVLVLPSLYEGFGLPILEAMASGTPVICGRNSSQIEVGGGAARLVDVGDPAALSSAMLDLLRNESQYTDMRQKGLEHAAAYRWSHTARKTMDIYRWCFEQRAL